METKAGMENEGGENKEMGNEMFSEQLKKSVLYLSSEIDSCISDICEKLDVLYSEFTKRDILIKIRQTILERKERLKKKSEEISCMVKRISNYKVIYDIDKLQMREANLKLLKKIIYSYYTLVDDFTKSICKYIDTNDAKEIECRFAIVFGVLLCIYNALDMYLLN